MIALFMGTARSPITTKLLYNCLVLLKNPLNIPKYSLLPGPTSAQVKQVKFTMFISLRLNTEEFIIINGTNSALMSMGETFQPFNCLKVFRYNTSQGKNSFLYFLQLMSSYSILKIFAGKPIRVVHFPKNQMLNIFESCQSFL